MAELQRTMQLRSASGEIFEVDEVVAMQSKFLRNVIQDVGVESPIPLPNVSTRTLEQVLDYCKRYAENAENNENDHVKCNDSLVSEALDEDFNDWPRNAKLVKLLDIENLYGLITAANCMHIESLLELICYTLARMIAKRTFGEIQQIFNLNNEFARAKQRLIGKESQLLAPLVDSLPTELQLKIKMKVGQRFHYKEWSPWRYDAEAQTLVVELADFYNPSNMHYQIAIILLHIDIGLVRTLVLQTCSKVFVSPHPSGGTCMEWVDPMDEDLFKDLFDGIDRLKIENIILDDET